MTPLFDLARVTYRYDRVLALESLTLSIAGGTRVALVGANGSGKSTLLRLLDGLVFPTHGTVCFEGAVLGETQFADETFASTFRRRVGLVFQNPDVQLFNPSVFEEVAFGPLQLGWTPAEVRDRVSDTLRSMRLSPIADRPPHHLSGGEKKRVALASVLVMDPEVLLLDEPTATLDPRSQSEIIDLLVDWSGGRRTVVTATHDLGLIEDVSDRCLVFDGGHLVADRLPSEVLADLDLLQRTNLVHAHRHRHGSTFTHSHAHVHRP